MGRPPSSEVALRLFRSYYRSLKADEVNVTELSRREFAFSYFGEEGMHRHIAFGSTVQLLAHLAERAPRHAFYSTAYYRDPAAKNMDEKGWEGSDLVFDIDIDHVETPCKELHDRWVCKSCGASGWGAPLACPRCGSESIERHAWVCETCLSVASDEVLRLIELLESDFGLSGDEMLVTFSGHRGFHVHVEAPAVRELNQDARREIVDYIRGVGLEPDYMLVKARGGYRLRAETYGWYGRCARWAIVKAGVENPTLSKREWEDLLRECVKREAVAVDERVTIDTRRLIRLPGSLHGKSGLRVARLSVQDLEGGSVLDKVKVFIRGEAVVEFEGEPPRRILDLEVGYSTRVLPLYAALYLLLNGAKLSKFELK